MSNSPVAIVTGGCQGLGAAICKELLSKKYKVCIADIQETKMQEFVKELETSYGIGNIIASSCDVSNESDYEKTFDLALKIFGRIDVVVNNAGIGAEDNPRRCLDVNLMGPIIGCRTALKYMGKSNGGKGGIVINTASMSGFLPCSAIPVYVASKHGVVGLTRCYGLPSHFDKDGIIFSALCPMFIDTPLIRAEGGIFYSGLNLSQYCDLMSPEYVAKAVSKLLEDRINGSTLVVTTEGYNYIGIQEELKHFKLL